MSWRRNILNWTTVNPAELLEHSPGVKILHISKYISYSELIPTEDGSTRLIYFVPGTLADEIPPFIRAWDWHGACDFLSLCFCLLLVFIWGPFTYEAYVAVQLSVNHDSMTPHRLFKYMNFMLTLSSGSLTSTNMPRPWVAGRYSSLCLSYSWVR